VCVCGLCVFVGAGVCVCGWVFLTQTGDDALDGVVFFCKSLKVRVWRVSTNVFSY
jgi:hypothetical protein